MKLFTDPVILVLELVESRVNTFQLIRLEFVKALHAFDHIINVLLGVYLLALLLVQFGVQLADHVLELGSLQHHLLQLLQKLWVILTLLLLCLLDQIAELFEFLARSDMDIVAT